MTLLPSYLDLEPLWKESYLVPSINNIFDLVNIQPLPIYSNFSASTIGNMEYHSALRSQEIQHHGSLLSA